MIVRPSTSTATIRKMGRRGEERKSHDATAAQAAISRAGCRRSPNEFAGTTKLGAAVPLEFTGCPEGRAGPVPALPAVLLGGSAILRCLPACPAVTAWSFRFALTM